jgi:hypothetical protein
MTPDPDWSARSRIYFRTLLRAPIERLLSAKNRLAYSESGDSRRLYPANFLANPLKTKPRTQNQSDRFTTALNWPRLEASAAPPE